MGSFRRRDAAREGAVGGGIFALRRPRPYRRHCGEGATTHATSTTICDKTDINGNGERGDNDAARRVATSFGERENMI